MSVTHHFSAPTVFFAAFETREIETFLELMFPPSWAGVAARIVESGATFSTDTLCPWAPRWSKIPPTVRCGDGELETAIKSCMFRVHDCLHQLWGLPLPSDRFDSHDFYLYKRSQMCGEVAVLTITEFAFAEYWATRLDHFEQSVFRKRNALPMIDGGPLQGKSLVQIAQRLDELLHKKTLPKWVREHRASMAFVDDYVPMLEADRANIDHNWSLMESAAWRPLAAPNSRYSAQLDGLELTQWMIQDFLHLRDTDAAVDAPLRDFNRWRRQGIVLPAGWNGAVPHEGT